MPDNSKSKTWLEKLTSLISNEPHDREDIRTFLKEAEKSHLLNSESFSMIEGVLQVSEMKVRDVMVTRSQMACIKHDMPLQAILPIIIESGHSRFPVIKETEDNIVGILLAKDLLRYCIQDNNKPQENSVFKIEDILRPTTFIPESKRLDTLLKEFRDKHSHLAIVADEYGGVAGLVTIEDVLEQIVGDIADEYDTEDDENEFIQKQNGQEYLINPILPIEDFNEYFQSDFSDEDFDTIGGLVLHQFGHLPKNGEQTKIEKYAFTVIHSDNRRMKLLKMVVE